MSSEVPINLLSLTNVPLRKFVYYMKYVADHDLWDVAVKRLQERGADQLLMSYEPIEAVRDLIREMAAEQLSDDTRTGDMVASHCGPGGVPPHTPGHHEPAVGTLRTTLPG